MDNMIPKDPPGYCPSAERIKVADLVGAELDYWVTAALPKSSVGWFGNSPWLDDETVAGHGMRGRPFKPSSDWRDGGPIIERERFLVGPHVRGGWCAWPSIGATHSAISEAAGPTPLIAAMRCFVTSKFGEEVGHADRN